MTAYARCRHEAGWGALSWELRSVNHRYLDLHPRLPEELRFLEGDVRERVGGRLARGKVECTLRYEAPAECGAALQINAAYADQLIAACTALGERLPHAAPISALELMRMPGVLEERPRDLTPVAEAARRVLDEALDELTATREREGTRLAALVGERAESIGELARRLRARGDEVNRSVRRRLLERIESLDANADPGRIEQELAIIAQRLDVTEELERLLTHIGEVTRVLAADEPVGRRLDFLMQELNREANTLSSKSADVATTQAAVEMKVLIEQMREQIQNIE